MQFGRSKATPEKPKSRSKTTRLGCLIPLPMTLYRFAGEEGGWLGGRRGVTGKLGWGSESGHKRGGNRVFGHQKDPLYILPPPWLNCFPRLSLAERVKSFNDGKKSKGFGKITGYLGIRTPVTVTRLPQPCGSRPHTIASHRMFVFMNRVQERSAEVTLLPSSSKPDQRRTMRSRAQGIGSYFPDQNSHSVRDSTNIL